MEGGVRMVKDSEGGGGECQEHCIHEPCGVMCRSFHYSMTPRRRCVNAVVNVSPTRTHYSTYDDGVLDPLHIYTAETQIHSYNAVHSINPTHTIYSNSLIPPSIALTQFTHTTFTSYHRMYADSFIPPSLPTTECMPIHSTYPTHSTN